MAPRAAPALTVALLLALLAGCTSTPLREADWIIARSPRFEILSTMSSDETIALAEDLERFHTLVYTLTGAEDRPSPIPTRIIAFARPSQLRGFTDSRAAGYFVEGTRANLIVLADYSQRLGAGEIILHEYVHFVVRNGNHRALPLWWDEGYAELLSTVERREDMIAIGMIPDSRKPWLAAGPWIPMSRIVSGTSYAEFPDEDRGMLYAEAFALVHYLMQDRENAGAIVEELPRYLGLLEQGVPPTEAFEQAFGLSTAEADRAVRRQLKRGLRIVGLPEERLEYDRARPTVRNARPEEVAIQLGQLQLRRGEAKAAEREFAAALALAPSNSRAQAGLGDALKFQEQWTEAGPYFDRACTLGPDDPLNHLDRAEYYHDRALAESSSDERRRLLEAARESYRRALALDPNHPETLLMSGRTHLAPGENPHLARAPIERAFTILPSASQIVMSLVETYVAIGQETMAHDLLVRTSAARAKDGVAQTAREQIEAIRQARKDGEAK